MILDFLYMQNSYEDRKVIEPHNKDGLFVSTAFVNDGSHPYETAVKHKDYNNGEMVIVQSYDSKDAAQKGHKEWIKLMTSNKKPKELLDCFNSEISQLLGEESMNPNRI